MSDDSDEEIDSDAFGEDEEEVQFKIKKASRSSKFFSLSICSFFPITECLFKYMKLSTVQKYS